MEIGKVETIEVKKTATEVELSICELADLELALVGGGHGDVVL